MKSVIVQGGNLSVKSTQQVRRNLRSHGLMDLNINVFRNAEIFGSERSANTLGFEGRAFDEASCQLPH